MLLLSYELVATGTAKIELTFDTYVSVRIQSTAAAATYINNNNNELFLYHTIPAGIIWIIMFSCSLNTAILLGI
jgi:hypothetical protein